jgi:hypothetical protein
MKQSRWRPSEDEVKGILQKGHSLSLGFFSGGESSVAAGAAAASCSSDIGKGERVDIVIGLGNQGIIIAVGI